MQGDRQIHLTAFARELLNLRDQAHRRDRESSGAESEPLRVVEPVDGFHRRIIVMERFTHTHDNDIGQPVAASGEPAGEEENLLDNFPCRQVAREPHLPGGTEDTGQCAAGLGGDADGPPTIVAHQDRFDGIPVGQLEQGFLCLSVARGQQLLQRQGAEGKGSIQSLAKPLGKIGHLIRRGGEALIDAAPDLLNAVGRLPSVADPLLERLGAEVEDRAPIRHTFGCSSAAITAAKSSKT